MVTLVPRRLFDLSDLFDRDFRLGDTPTIRMEDHISEQEYELVAELPGVDPEKDVEVTIDGDILNIRAERREESKMNGRSEFRYGRMERSVRLPANADAEHITAGYTNGLLAVKVPLTSAKANERKIEVTAGSEASQKAVGGK